MNMRLISEYLARPDYKNVVLAEYLNDDVTDTCSLLSTCSAEELSKVFAVIENVVLHFMDEKIVNLFKKRKAQLKIKWKDHHSRLKSFFDRDNENFLLIKSIVDELDPLKLLQNNASYTCYNVKIEDWYLFLGTYHTKSERSF